MIIENTQQLDELIGAVARAAGRAVGTAAGTKSRMKRAARNVGRAYKSGVKSGFKTATGRQAPKRGSLGFAAQRAKRRIKVAGGDLMKNLRGKKTGYDVNVKRTTTTRTTRQNNVAANRKWNELSHRAKKDPELYKRLKGAQDRVLARRKAQGKPVPSVPSRTKPPTGTLRVGSKPVGKPVGPKKGMATLGRRPVSRRMPMMASWNMSFANLINEVSPPGFEGTVKAMKKHREIDNPYALSWYMKNKGYESHKNKDGTDKK
jgi:hypothetical protein